MTISRRHLLATGTGFAFLSGTSFPAFAQAKAEIVIVGGGFGGAMAARQLKALQPAANITLVERNRFYVSCPFSNLVLSGERTLKDQTFDYQALSQTGINIRNDAATDVDPVQQTVTLSSGETLAYDKLILSPGVDMRFDAIEGYDEAAAQSMPHAWKAGPQTALLRQKLIDMPNGGLVVMSVPPAPYRCPPGPYERASLIAHYLKTRKPKSKLLILDAKDSFSKQPLFQEAWRKHYPDHLEWRGASDDGRVSSVDASRSVVSTDFEDIAGDVATIIPPQRAGEIAHRAGVSDATGWCPVSPISFASTLQDNIHVIGDATIAAPMPKSAFSASLQAKICAIAIARNLSGLPAEPTVLTNTCYSYATPNEAFSITGVYSNAGERLKTIEGSGGLSPLNADGSTRQSEALQAADWFAAITSETFG